MTRPARARAMSRSRGLHSLASPTADAAARPGPPPQRYGQRNLHMGLAGEYAADFELPGQRRLRTGLRVNLLRAHATQNSARKRPGPGRVSEVTCETRLSARPGIPLLVQLALASRRRNRRRAARGADRHEPDPAEAGVPDFPGAGSVGPLSSTMRRSASPSARIPARRTTSSPSVTRLPSIPPANRPITPTTPSAWRTSSSRTLISSPPSGRAKGSAAGPTRPSTSRGGCARERTSTQTATSSASAHLCPIGNTDLVPAPGERRVAPVGAKFSPARAVRAPGTVGPSR